MVWIAHKELRRDALPPEIRLVPAFSSTIYERQIGIFGRPLRAMFGERRYQRKILSENDWEVWARHRTHYKCFEGDRLTELCAALEDVRPSEADRIVIHSADPQTVDMLSTWASRRPRNTLPTLHIRTCWSKNNMPFSNYGGGYVRALQRLIDNSRVTTLSCETERGAHQLAQQTGLRVGVCPPFVEPMLLNADTSQHQTGVIRIGWLGEPRQEKGAALLPEIIARVLAARPSANIQFLLQCAGRRRRWLDELNAKLDKFGDSVSRLPSDLGTLEYGAALRSCDVILLPYDRVAYPAERGSGLAIEALLMAKPIVATTDTFAATIVTPESGRLGHDAESLADGIIEIVDNMNFFREGANLKRNRDASSYAPEGLYKKLLGATI